MPAVFITAGITIVSLWENPQMEPAIMVSDKLVHGLMYMLLAISWTMPLVRTRNARAFPIYSGVCLTVTTYGGLIELLQHWCTRTRTGDLADFLADFVGALAGIAMVVIFRFIQKQMVQNK